MKMLAEGMMILSIPLAIILGYLAHKYNWPVIKDL
jgi:hypothetical protein